MDSIELIKRWGRIMHGRIIIEGTRPIKRVEPDLFEFTAEVPDKYVTGWWTYINTN